VVSGINRNMRCIEIADIAKGAFRPHTINRNMRCIEMVERKVQAKFSERLIET